MSYWVVLETVVGLLLLFFLPGYGLTRAVFPEWRLRGPGRLRRAVETVTLSFVLSVVLTVLVGYVLLSASPGGFQASWNDPLLEAILAAVAGLALLVAAMEGAFGRPGPTPPSHDAAGAAEEGAWELSRDLERLMREERRISKALAAPSVDADEGARLRARLERVRADSAALRARREAEYAQ